MLAWRGHLLCGFDRHNGLALDIDETPLTEMIKGCYPKLGLAELARLNGCLKTLSIEWHREFREALFSSYNLRWCDRLESALDVILRTPRGFQDFADEKGFSVRDFSVLLALPEVEAFQSFLEALPGLPLSKSEAVRTLELGAELFLLGRPLSDLLPTDDRGSAYLQRLERWRRPQSNQGDEAWREDVASWPWPAQVQGYWQRFGDQSGLEIKIKTTSPEDLNKKLQKLLSIGETWSCKT